MLSHLALLSDIVFSNIVGGIENHGCQALAWSYELLTNSSRSRLPGTKNVIIYATNGNVTDQDSYFGPMYNSWTHAANWFKEKGTKNVFFHILHSARPIEFPVCSSYTSTGASSSRCCNMTSCLQLILLMLKLGNLCYPVPHSRYYDADVTYWKYRWTK